MQARSKSLPIATGPGIVPRSRITNHWIPRASDLIMMIMMMKMMIKIIEHLALGSTQRSVAVRVGMLARKVTNMVRKREARKMGRRGQEAGQGPGVAIRFGGKSREGDEVVGDEGRHEQLVKTPWSRAWQPA